jgi:hypothetical protein
MPLKEGLARTIAWFAEEMGEGDREGPPIKVAVAAE